MSEPDLAHDEGNGGDEDDDDGDDDDDDDDDGAGFQDCNIHAGHLEGPWRDTLAASEFCK